MSDHRPALSMVVAAYNEESSIDGLIDALEAQTLPRERFELLLVSDGSTDLTAERIRDREWPVVIESKENLGLPSARNLGAAQARGEIVTFTDADCRPDPDYLERGLAHFEADPDLGMMGARVDFSMPPDPPLAAMLDLVCEFRDLGRIDLGGHILGGVTWIRRPLFEQVGGYNEDLARYGAEDKELTAAVVTAGAKIEAVRDARLTHPPRTSLRQIARKSFALGYGLAMQKRFSRHPSLNRPILLNPRAYVPKGSINRIWRLEEAGIHPGPLLRLRLVCAEWVFMVLPKLAGKLAGLLDRRPSGSGRSRSSTPLQELNGSPGTRTD